MQRSKNDPDLAAVRQDLGRVRYLDGLRGVGALSVVFHHYIGYLAASLGIDAARDSAWAVAGFMPLLTNGPFYVKVFFVLSGFVLAGSVASGRTPLVASITIRYLRLSVTMTVALIFTWLVGATLPHPGSVPITSLGAAVTLGIWGLYLHGPPSSNYPLWTIPFELAGSWAIYFCYKLSGRFRVQALLVLALLCLVRANALGFAAGALLRELHAAGKLRWSVWNWLALGACVFVCCGRQYGWIVGPEQDRQIHNFYSGLADTLGATALIYFVLTAPKAQSLLQSRPIQFLAHISFGLYLIHFPLIFPVEWLGQHFAGGPAERLLLSLIIFVGTSIIFGWLLTVLVDDPLLRGLKHLKKGPLARWTFAGF